MTNLLIRICMKVTFVIIVYTELIVVVEKCMLVEDSGPDVLEKVSDVIAPHGCCAGYEANLDKLHDTRSPTEAPSENIDTEKNKKKVTTADVT